MIELSRFMKSFQHALRGVRVVFSSEQSFRIQFYITLFVLVLAVVFRVSLWEWIVLLFLAGAVLSLELINSVFERMIDAFKPRIHPVVRDIKDVMAGTVLIASLIAAAIGIIIFSPYVLELVRLITSSYT